jgi:hypothetical protein
MEGLEFDHIDPSNKTHHAIWSWSKPRREAEMDKCELRCCGCHLKRTASQRYERDVAVSAHTMRVLGVLGSKAG